MSEYKNLGMKCGECNEEMFVWNGDQWSQPLKKFLCVLCFRKRDEIFFQRHKIPDEFKPAAVKILRHLERTVIVELGSLEHVLENARYAGARDALKALEAE